MGETGERGNTGARAGRRVGRGGVVAASIASRERAPPRAKRVEILFEKKWPAVFAKIGPRGPSH